MLVAATVDYFRALAWPVVALLVAVIIAWRFGANVRHLLDRTTHVGVGPVKLDTYVHLQQESPVFSKAAEEALRDLEPVSEEAPDDDADPCEALRQELTIVRAGFDFERAYAVIFGSQLELLRAVATRVPARPVSRSMIGQYLAEAKKRAQLVGEDLSAWTVDTYVQFLIGQGFFEAHPATTPPTPRTYEITQRGREFIAYVDVTAELRHAKPL